MQKCLTCGGVYAPVQRDGTDYYHACPSLSDAEVGRALGLPDEGTTWTKAQRDAVAAAPRDRPNARDENVDASKRVRDPTTGQLGAAPIKAAGLGVVAV